MGDGAGVGRTGSSPRLRGAPEHHGRRREWRGIIPALAGSTSSALSTARTNWDHPRACGEHQTETGRQAWQSGSSPRLRGARVLCGQAWGAHGIIPALAGSTRSRLMCRAAPRDHPRACGEHTTRRSVMHPCQGSSPRLRGAPKLWYVWLASNGIIPALAGSTAGIPVTLTSKRDHPRACGEHVMALGSRNTAVGSSPRLRGAPDTNAPAVREGGIIPALAGSTRRTTSTSPYRRDHPRACGEHHTACLIALRSLGSSPRLRGALLKRRKAVDIAGIIPALAGSTIRPCGCVRRARDHPRACGEHSAESAASSAASGSSPRLRGALQLLFPWRVGDGIIPALAGSTVMMPPVCE
ncbi:hypothetical protein CGZ88_0858 [Bifidobacterium anseris]|uniref:Uncharacterized protein n=1 Tax=Bifidobacterium anseris TaxID=2020963 RepID=A0A2N5IZF4_9BIFI|nr:hypothetical protein CGZ88_0858 [Bifidobacterium anseris]